MSIEVNKLSKTTKSQCISAQISFRHSPSVRERIIELAYENNMSEADMSRQLINSGLKANYGIDVRGNQVV